MSAPAHAVQICSCHWLSARHGTIAKLCAEHQAEYDRARCEFRLWPKQEIWYDIEGDARDRVTILDADYPGPGYDLKAEAYPVAGRWLVLAHYFSTE